MKKDATGLSLTEGTGRGFSLPPAEFVGRLEPFERVLLELKDRLYEGSWNRIRTDLESRRDNKPYIFKLSKTIERDLAAVARLEAYEKKWNVSLREELNK